LEQEFIPEVIVAPSILSADFACLGEQVAAVERGGAALIHVDVMDGHFVPNITIGPPVVRSLRKATSLPLDCHLMIAEPDRYLEAFREAGADSMSVHVETTVHLERTVARIRELGARVGVALNPATSLSSLEEVLPELDHVVVMSVNPGFGGQKFLPGAVDKVRRLSRLIDQAGSPALIEVDGGVDETNARALAEAGASILVAGSAVFGADDPVAAVGSLSRAANSQQA
jgi:ribulose-phosphate 3-epimerase